MILRGLGVSLALPTLESFMGRGARSVPPRRLAIIAVPFGMVEEWFHPEAAGRDWECPPTLAPLAALCERFTVFSGLDHGVRGGHSATDSFLNGVKSTERASDPEKSLTLDQRVAEVFGRETRFPSLVFWSAGTNFTRAGVRVPSLATPSQAFHLLFRNGSESERLGERAALSTRRSVLDLVQADARALAGNLGSADRAKLDEYFTSIRELEGRLESSMQWLARPRPPVDDPRAAAFAAGELDEPYGEKALEAWLDLAHLALWTDSARALTVAMPGCIWGLPGASGGYHSITHHDQRPEVLDQLRIIEVFLTTQLARFLQRLSDTRQADGSSLLDSTQVLFGSGLGSGSRHTNTNLPLILAGGRFHHGQHLDLGNREPLCNLYLSMLHELGIEDERFSRSERTLGGLEFG